MSFVIIVHDDMKISCPVALLSEDKLEVAVDWVRDNYAKFPKSFRSLTVFKFRGRKPETAWNIDLRPSPPDPNWPVWREGRNVLPPDYPWTSDA